MALPLQYEISSGTTGAAGAGIAEAAEAPEVAGAGVAAAAEVPE